MTTGTAPDESTPNISLVGGVNFSTWPYLKWSRGNSHIAALQSSINEWHASAPASIDEVLREDSQGIDLVARVPRAIPTHEWALTLGDALHNLRSAFDAVAWGMAHFAGAEPRNPKKVQFPICDSTSKWNDVVRAWIGELDPQFQERIRVVQPFNYAPQGSHTVLSMLHELDIQDKHKDAMTVAARLQVLNLSGSFEYIDPDSPTDVRIEMNPDTRLEDGAVLGTMYTGAPIRMVGQMLLQPGIQVQLTHGETTHDVMAMLGHLSTESLRYLGMLMHGVVTPDDAPEGGSGPIDVTDSPRG